MRLNHEFTYCSYLDLRILYYNLPPSLHNFCTYRALIWSLVAPPLLIHKEFISSIKNEILKTVHTHPHTHTLTQNTHTHTKRIIRTRNKRKLTNHNLLIARLFTGCTYYVLSISWAYAYIWKFQINVINLAKLQTVYWIHDS